MNKKNFKKALFINGNKCKTKEDLFAEFSKKLSFPYFFSNNWDSFEEIIHDLDSNCSTVIIYNSESFLKSQPEERVVLLEILESANQQNEYEFYILKKL
jgi:RNAse (barnase) inhibitor barstar